jgi:hypothetical protein
MTHTNNQTSQSPYIYENMVFGIKKRTKPVMRRVKLKSSNASYLYSWRKIFKNVKKNLNSALRGPANPFVITI